MFSGLVTDVGRVRSVHGEGEARVAIECTYDMDDIALGASIACAGVCLTVVDKGAQWFAVDVSGETLACTTLADWRPDVPVNLERSLKVGDELGGHFVSGHVDATAEVVKRTPEGASVRFEFAVAERLQRFIAAKGAIALDGVSLTVNDVDGAQFSINMIPHTQNATTFKRTRPGQRVNVEVDMLARYLARLTAQD